MKCCNLSRYCECGHHTSDHNPGWPAGEPLPQGKFKPHPNCRKCDCKSLLTRCKKHRESTPVQEDKECIWCHGTGEMTIDDTGTTTHVTKCPECNGTGREKRKPLNQEDLEERVEGECQACKLGDKAAYPGVHSGTFCVLPGSPKGNDRIKRLRRRADHLRKRVDVRKESYDKAELSALDWAIDKLANYESDMEERETAARKDELERLKTFKVDGYPTFNEEVVLITRLEARLKELNE